MFNLRKRDPAASLAIEWRERSPSPRTQRKQTVCNKKLKTETPRRPMDIEFDWTDEKFVGFLDVAPTEGSPGYFDQLDREKSPYTLNPLFNDCKLVHRETASQFKSLVVQIMKEYGLSISEIKKRVSEEGFLEKAYVYLKEVAKQRHALRDST